jgi:hypothetical protein
MWQLQFDGQTFQLRDVIKFEVPCQTLRLKNLLFDMHDRSNPFGMPRQTTKEPTSGLMIL